MKEYTLFPKMKKGWMLNQKDMWVKRNEKGYIIETIDIDIGYLSDKPIVKYEIFGKKPKVKTFDNWENARKYAHRLMNKR